MTNSHIILEAKNISKSFGAIALDQVSLDIKKGEVHGLVGENGAGKSTFIKIIAGVYQKDDGEIFLNGEKIVIENPQKASSLGFSFIHQELYQVPYFTVGESFFFGRKYPTTKLGFIDWKAVKKKAKEELSKFDVPAGLESSVNSRTSMAYRYITEIAKAVSQDCKVLFMDEPTASLTKEETDILFKIISDLKQRGMSIVYITHRLEEIFKICDRVTVFRDAKLVGSYNINEIDIESIIYKMLGESLKDKIPKSKIDFGKERLRVENLESDAIDVTNFSIRTGEVIGVIGLVGSGRTELANLLYGLDKKNSGKIYIDNKPVEINGIQDAIKYGIGFVPEDRHKQGIILNLVVKENMTLANFDKYTFAWIGIINDTKEKRTAQEYVTKLRIKTPSINTKTQDLSGGNQQKVIIAKWLDTNPKIMIFDEPTKGIDIGSKTEVYLLIQKMAKDGTAIIFISSEIEEILGLSDRFLVMYKGQVISEFVTKDATSDQVAIAMQLGKVKKNGNGNNQRQKI